MSQVLRVTLLALALVGSAACVLSKSGVTTSAPDVDRTLTTHSYIEEGELLTFIVDIRATRERDRAEYIPLEIAIGNRGLPRLNLTRESFTLIDADGNRYPCVGPRDLLDRYDYLDFDRLLGELAGITTNKFANFTRYASQFSPVRGASTSPGTSSLVRDVVTLPKFGYLIDFLYFPAPAGGVLGRKFELFLEAPELENPVFVKFLVK